MFRRFMLIVALFMSLPAGATTVAIVQGGFYTPDLKNNLVNAGVTVSEIANYTAASLAAFDSVIHYGNTFTDQAALETYVAGGGNLLLTPWAGWNFAVNPNIQIFDNGGAQAQHSQNYPGVTLLDAGDPLLNGVVFPAGPGGFDIGRITGIGFVGGVAQVAAWADGPALLGYKAFGAGQVVGLNMQIITSDTAYQVINQAWATQLVLNAIGGAQVVSEPAALILLLVGLAGIVAARRLRQSA